MELALAYMNRVRETKKKKVDNTFSIIREEFDKNMEQYIGEPNTAMTHARIEANVFDYIRREASDAMARQLDANILNGFLEIDPFSRDSGWRSSTFRL